jgi:hypothetical protein
MSCADVLNLMTFVFLDSLLIIPIYVGLNTNLVELFMSIVLNNLCIGSKRLYYNTVDD